MTTSSLVAAAQQLYTTGKYSDLEIRCGTLVAKIHKNIVCAQSEWFAKAVDEGRFLEGYTGVIEFKDMTAEAVKAMIEFLYTGGYHFDNDKSNIDAMLSHLDVYAAGDLIQHNQLRNSAEQEFSNLVRDNFMDEGFPRLIHKVYEVAPPGPNGQRLRQILVDVAAGHAKSLFAVHEDFEGVIEQVPAFGANLSLALCRLSTMALKSFTILTAICDYCGNKFHVNLEDEDSIMHCPQNCPKRYWPEIQDRSNWYTCSVNHVFTSTSEPVRCISCKLPVTRV